MKCEGPAISLRQALVPEVGELVSISGHTVTSHCLSGQVPQSTFTVCHCGGTQGMGVPACEPAFQRGRLNTARGRAYTSKFVFLWDE